jgi:PIN domain nuclease of toxin-antitoxin system
LKYYRSSSVPQVIEVGHLSILRDLPLHYRDRFDRSIVAQAQSADMMLVAADGVFDY